MDQIKHRQPTPLPLGQRRHMAFDCHHIVEFLDRIVEIVGSESEVAKIAKVSRRRFGRIRSAADRLPLRAAYLLAQEFSAPLNHVLWLIGITPVGRYIRVNDDEWEGEDDGTRPELSFIHVGRLTLTLAADPQLAKDLVDFTKLTWWGTQPRIPRPLKREPLSLDFDWSTLPEQHIGKRMNRESRAWELFRYILEQRDVLDAEAAHAMEVRPPVVWHILNGTMRLTLMPAVKLALWANVDPVPLVEEVIRSYPRTMKLPFEFNAAGDPLLITHFAGFIHEHFQHLR